MFSFFVKCLKEQPHNFGVLINYVTFANSQTPFSSASKLNVNHCRTSSACHFYFNRIVHLWNVNPNIDTSLPFCSINRYMYSFLWKHFLENFGQTILVHLTLFVLVPLVINVFLILVPNLCNIYTS